MTIKAKEIVNKYVSGNYISYFDLKKDIHELSHDELIALAIDAGMTIRALKSKEKHFLRELTKLNEAYIKVKVELDTLREQTNNSIAWLHRKVFSQAKELRRFNEQNE